MQKNPSKLAHIAASVAILAALSTLPATAAVRHGHARNMHRIHHRIASHPLTVRRDRFAIAPAPDPYHGPAAFITAPIAAAGFVVGLPFRLIASVFPPNANDPRVVVGAPVYAAGRIAQFPFYAIDSAFGTPPNYY